MENLPGSVLGVAYSTPIEGSPLIPPDLLTLYFAFFLLLLSLAYLFLRIKGREIGIKQRLKKVFWLGVVLKVLVIVGGGLIAAYWFIPTPNVVKTSPAAASNLTSPTQKIEVIFDRPVSRKALEKSIQPEVAGVWIFERNFYRTHLFRSVTFYPTQNLKPDTNYQITLSNIKTASGMPGSHSYQFSFKTEPQPKVLKVEPNNDSTNVATSSPIKVILDNPNNDLSEFDFEVEPKTPFTLSLDKPKLEYNLKFGENLKQGTKYTLRVKTTDLSINPQTKEIIARGETKIEHLSTFTTKPPPGIESATPTGTGVALISPITIKFSTQMNKKSVEDHFQIAPVVQGELIWRSNQILEFKPHALSYETSYKITISKGALGLDGGFLEEDSVFQFSTIGSVKVISVNPVDGWKGVTLTGPISVTFDQAVDRKSAEEKFSITPSTSGQFSWDQNTIIFTPSKNLAASTTYNLSLASGIKGLSGPASKSNLTYSFTTHDEVVKLAVPAFLQQHALSCELSALRMALAFRGVNVSEETLLTQVGVDNTPHQGNIWGNPNQAFVGNVDGRQMVNGYGVHWAPIARVAGTYRGAKEFSGWSVKDLTEALAAGNPVVIWVYSSGGWPTSWFTPSGENILALRDEHAVTAVGFVGNADNPTQLVVNDPLYGQVYWPRPLFDRKWGLLGRSGVVVF